MADTRTPQDYAQPFWFAIVSDEAPIVGKAVRRKDLADEYADGCRVNGYPGVKVVPLYAAPQSGWISVDERLPEVGIAVLVYEPPRPEDWPRTARISIDHICPDYEYWHDHSGSYEHFMAIGGANAVDPDCPSTGPDAKAPYTHWMPLPPPPSTKGESNGRAV